MKVQWEGVIRAVTTPFDENGRADEAFALYDSFRPPRSRLDGAALAAPPGSRAA
jgi:hypothetical protein